MSKPIKRLIQKELASRFQGLTSLAIVGLTGLDANANNAMRGRLLEKGIRLTVVKNSMARKAFADVDLAVAGDLLDGPCAVAYASDPQTVSVVEIVRELLDIHKEHESVVVKAAVLEGEPFGADQVETLSKFPTRDEALSQLVGSILSAGANVGACLLGPSGAIASILKKIEEDAGGEDGEAEAA